MSDAFIGCWLLTDGTSVLQTDLLQCFNRLFIREKLSATHKQTNSNFINIDVLDVNDVDMNMSKESDYICYYIF